MSEPTIEPGIYRGKSIEDYHRGPGFSRSDIVRVGTGTPMDWQHYRRQGAKPSDALDLGTAVHHAILEPEVFDARYGPLPPGDGRTKAVKEARAEWHEQNPDRIGLDSLDYQRAREASDMVRRKKGPRTVMRQGHVEESLYWHDPATGLLMKSRPDFRDAERSMIVDVKTTKRGLDDADVVRFLHDHFAAVQLAMMNEGLAQLKAAGHDCEPCETYLLLVRIDPYRPLDMRLVHVDLDWRARGERLYFKWTRRLAALLESGEWPGWAESGVTECPMPKWLHKREMAEQEEDEREERAA